MARCQKIKRKKRQVCVGDLNKEIVLQNRNIAEPLFGSPDFDENFTTIATVWAAVNTVSGKTYFDGVGTDINITHEIFIRYDATVTAESWVQFGGRRIDILNTEDLDERGEFMKLVCNDRGLTAAEASKT